MGATYSKIKSKTIRDENALHQAVKDGDVVLVRKLTLTDEHVRKMSDRQGCQIAKFDPFLSLDCARVEGVGAQSKERKGSNFAA